jgi:hypothetical protein
VMASAKLELRLAFTCGEITFSFSLRMRCVFCYLHVHHLLPMSNSD